MGQVGFDPDALAIQAHGGHRRGAVAQKRVQHQIAFIGGGPQAAFDQRHGLLRWMLAECFFVRAGSAQSPDI